MGLPRDGEESGRVLFFIAVASVLSNCEKVRVAEAVLVGGVGSVGDGVSFGRDVGGAGCLTGRLSHSLGIGVVLAVVVAAENKSVEGRVPVRKGERRLGTGDRGERLAP